MNFCILLYDHGYDQNNDRRYSQNDDPTTKLANDLRGSYSFDDPKMTLFHPFTEGELNSDQSAIPQHSPSVCS